MVRVPPRCLRFLPGYEKQMATFAVLKEDIQQSFSKDFLDHSISSGCGGILKAIKVFSSDNGHSVSRAYNRNDNTVSNNI